MVILKKLKSSTLMETLVATVLIIIVFVVTSMILNSIFFNAFKSNTNTIENHLKEVEYLINNDKIQQYNTSYSFQDWEITTRNKDSLGINYIILSAKNSKTEKVVQRTLIKND